VASIVPCSGTRGFAHHGIQRGVHVLLRGQRAPAVRSGSSQSGPRWFLIMMDTAIEASRLAVPPGENVRLLGNIGGPGQHREHPDHNAAPPTPHCARLSTANIRRPPNGGSLAMQSPRSTPIVRRRRPDPDTIQRASRRQREANVKPPVPTTARQTTSAMQQAPECPELTWRRRRGLEPPVLETIASAAAISDD
jgi:hypothetical protein